MAVAHYPAKTAPSEVCGGTCDRIPSIGPHGQGRMFPMRAASDPRSLSALCARVRIGVEYSQVLCRASEQKVRESALLSRVAAGRRWLRGGAGGDGQSSADTDVLTLQMLVRSRLDQSVL